MTEIELEQLKNSPYVPYVYADKNGIRAFATMRTKENREFEVSISCPGVVESINSDFMVIRWDHYYFENHKIQELLPNPKSTLKIPEDLELIRINKYPSNVRLT